MGAARISRDLARIPAHQKAPGPIVGAGGAGEGIDRPRIGAAFQERVASQQSRTAAIVSRAAARKLAISASV